MLHTEANYKSSVTSQKIWYHSTDVCSLQWQFRNLSLPEGIRRWYV